MTTIRILPESLRNQIAAGEVVERPASVVKELVENALDAESTQIDIEISAGGSEQILIRDNGLGMSAEDAVMALKRYATSKIAKSDDLFDLHSFGFRGEALASIASVSQLSLTTKQEEGTHGIRIIASSGEQQEVAAPTGTEIKIQNLFHNVPARKKFLKTEKTEMAHIANIVENIALSNPEVGFRLRSESRTLLDVTASPGDDALMKRVIALFGKEFAENMFPVQYLGDQLQISGFISHPHVHRRNRNNQRIFVNHRPITDKLIFAAINQAYETLIPRGLHPDVILFLDIAPDLVDVNVHPRKSEVKFLQEREIFSAVRGAIKSALEVQPKISTTGSGEFGARSRELGVNSREKKEWTLRSSSPKDIQGAIDFSQKFLGGKSHTISQSISEKKRNLPNSERASSASKQHKRVVGQIRNSFILIETDEGLIIMDQHAAHERVRFQKLWDNLRNKTPQSQKLLVPQVLNVTATEQQTLEAHRAIFEALGFEIQDFSDMEVSLYAVPVGTEKIDFPENLKNLLHDLEGVTPEEGKTLSVAAERIIGFAACRGAIKFGDPLTLPEMEQLVTDVEACSGGFSCAHGRPVVMEVSYDEMEKAHGR